MVKTVGICVLILNSFVAISQTKDANFWLSAGLSTDLTKKINMSYETQTRFYKNATSFDSYYNEFGVEYSPLKQLGIAVDYRLAYKNKETFYETVNRICLSATYSQKLDFGVTLKARVRYQVPFNRLGIVNDNIYPDSKNVVRFKIAAKYKPLNFKWLQPYSSFEIYKGVRVINIYNAIDSYRFTFGGTLDLPKRHSVDFYYMLEKEFKAVPNLNHIWGIQYNYELFKDPIITSKTVE